MAEALVTKIKSKQVTAFHDLVPGSVYLGACSIMVIIVGCFSGNNDECEAGFHRCDGNTYEYCYRPPCGGDIACDTSLTLIRTPCNGDYQCNDAGGGCVYGGTEYAGCAAAPTSGYLFCEGDLAIRCRGTYRIEHRTCDGCAVDSDGFITCSTNVYGSCTNSAECASGLACLRMSCTRSCSDASECYDLSYPAQCYAEEGVCSGLSLLVQQ